MADKGFWILDARKKFCRRARRDSIKSNHRWTLISQISQIYLLALRTCRELNLMRAPLQFSIFSLPAQGQAFTIAVEDFGRCMLAYCEQTKNESLVAVVARSAVIMTMAGLKASARQERFKGKLYRTPLMSLVDINADINVIVNCQINVVEKPILFC